LSLIRLSDDWRILTTLALQNKLKSTQPGTVQRFVDNNVNAPENKKATIFVELLKFLEEVEQENGEKPLIFDIWSNLNGGQK